MTTRFDHSRLSAIANGTDDTYNKINISSYWCKGSTVYEMEFFHKNTRTSYIVNGVVKSGLYGGKYTSWDPKTVKRVGKFTKVDQQQYAEELCYKNRLHWDESGL